MQEKKNNILQNIARYMLLALAFTVGYIYPLAGIILYVFCRVKRRIRSHSIFRLRRYPLAGAAASLIVFAVEYIVQFINAA